MKNTLKRINSRLDTVDINISDIKAIALEKINNEVQRGRRSLGVGGPTRALVTGGLSRGPTYV